MNKKEKLVYLVRHGQVQFPDGRKYYLGQTDVPLSEVGMKQAEWLRQFFADKHIAAIYHSPMQRCRETAERCADGLIPCIGIDDLREIHMGQWEMLPMEYVRDTQAEAYQLRGEQIDIFCPPGGESFVQCQRRSVAAIQKLFAAQKPGTAIVIVAHAGVNRCLLSWIQNQPLRDLMTIAQPYGCVTELRWANGVWCVCGTTFSGADSSFI